MKRHVRNILTLPGVNRAITEYRTEVFTGCTEKNTCQNSEDYLIVARQLGFSYDSPLAFADDV